MSGEKRVCDVEHLRDYPGCYEECDKDRCDGKPMSEQDLLLTDEEINKAVKGERYYGQTQVANSWLRDRAIAKAQLAKVKQHYEAQIIALQEIIQYLEQNE